MEEQSNQKISQITELLEQLKTSDKLSELISMLGKKNPDTEDSREKDSIANDSGAELLMNAKRLLENPSMKNDPRLGLLSSLRPFLGNKRKGTLEQCVKILKLTSLTKNINEIEGIFKKGGDGT